MSLAEVIDRTSHFNAFLIFSDDVADDDAIQPAADESGFQFNANQNLEFNF